jgi:putative transposase
MLKTNIYRIYPNTEQILQINKTFGCTRLVYNKMLAFKIALYNQTLMSYSKTECNNWTNRVLKEEYPFLREVDKFSLTNAVYNLDAAYKHFFKDNKGFPKFKSKKGNYNAYTTNYTNNNITVDYDGNLIKLPKLGYVKAKVHRSIVGKIKTATVSRVPSGKYFVSITYECSNNKILLTTDKNVGIDLGIKNLIITSDGMKYENPYALKQYQSRLKKLERKLSKKKKGSNNYKRQKKKIAICYEKITNIRKDNLHKISSKLINENQVIVTEDLRVSNMMKNHNLAGSIADASFGELVRQLEYKSKWYGRTLIKVDTFYPSSQLCHVCGYKNSDVKDLSIRTWVCPNCHTSHDRDTNAAINILQEGLRVLS